MVAMVQPVLTPQRIIPTGPSRKAASAIVTGAVAIGVALVLGAVALWVHYGTAVFFEMITSGIAGCF